MDARIRPLDYTAAVGRCVACISCRFMRRVASITCRFIHMANSAMGPVNLCFGHAHIFGSLFLLTYHVNPQLPRAHVPLQLPRVVAMSVPSKLPDDFASRHRHTRLVSSLSLPPPSFPAPVRPLHTSGHNISNRKKYPIYTPPPPPGQFDPTEPRSVVHPTVRAHQDKERGRRRTER